MSDRSPTYMADSCMPIEKRACSDAASEPVEPVTALPCIRSWISRGAAVHAVCGYQRPLPLSMPYRVFWSRSSQVWPTRASIHPSPSPPTPPPTSVWCPDRRRAMADLYRQNLPLEPPPRVLIHSRVGGAKGSGC
jgi:hypothetical protein